MSTQVAPEEPPFDHIYEAASKVSTWGLKRRRVAFLLKTAEFWKFCSKMRGGCKTRGGGSQSDMGAGQRGRGGCKTRGGGSQSEGATQGGDMGNQSLAGDSQGGRGGSQTGVEGIQSLGGSSVVQAEVVCEASQGPIRQVSVQTPMTMNPKIISGFCKQIMP